MAPRPGTRRSIALALSLALASGPLGCATIVRSGSATVPVSCNVESAKITANGVTVEAGPLRVRRDRSTLIRAEAPGYKPDEVQTEVSPSVGYLLVDVLLLFPFGLIDAVTGDWNNVEPEEVHLHLDKEAPAK